MPRPIPRILKLFPPILRDGNRRHPQGRIRGDGVQQARDKQVLAEVVLFVEGPARVDEVEGVVEGEDGAVDGPVVGEAAEGALEDEARGWFHGVGACVGAAEDVHSVGGVALGGVGGAKVDPPVVFDNV